MKQKGVTLIEMVILIAILAIITAIVIPACTKEQPKEVQQQEDGHATGDIDLGSLIKLEPVEGGCMVTVEKELAQPVKIQSCPALFQNETVFHRRRNETDGGVTECICFNRQGMCIPTAQ